MSDDSPRWEHGYRCHGLWQGMKRLGRVSLGPPGLWDGLYRWDLDDGGTSGTTKSLRAGKRAVEKSLGLPPCPKA